MENAGIDTSLNTQHSTHNFWRDFTEHTYILSFFRNPIKRAISEFCYEVDFGASVEKKANNLSINQDNPKKTLDAFEVWMNTIHTPNYQALVLSGKQINIPLSTVNDNISKINLFCSVEEFRKSVSFENWSNSKGLRLVNKIIKDLSLGEQKTHVPMYEHYGYYDFISSPMWDQITREKSILSQLTELNKVDMEIWCTASFFS